MANSSAYHSSSSQAKVRPHATLFRLGLQPLIVHFKSESASARSVNSTDVHRYIDPGTLDQFDTKILTRLLSDTARNLEVREQLGNDRKVWEDLKITIWLAVKCMTEMCCSKALVTGQPGVGDGSAEREEDVPEEDEDVPSSGMIVENSHSLVRDLARLISLLGIARNVLTLGVGAQDLAADVGVDDAVQDVIRLCIMVTGRGFDSSGNREDEKRWQEVVNQFKRLLGLALQFFNNFTAQNERRKLMLWIGLFDAGDAILDSRGAPDMVDRRVIDALKNDPFVNGSMARSVAGEWGVGSDGVPHVIKRFKDGLLAHMNRIEEKRASSGQTREPILDKEHLSSSPFLLYIGKVGTEIKRELQAQGTHAGATEIAAECKRRWQNMSKEEQKSWHDYYTQLLANYREEVTRAGQLGEQQRNEQNVAVGAMTLWRSIDQIQRDIRRQDQENQSIERLDDEVAPSSEDYRITCSSSWAQGLLKQGKEDLLSRIEPGLRRSRSRRARTRSPDPAQPLTEVPPRSESQPVPDPPDAPLTLASEDGRELLSDEEGSEYDDAISGDDGRGLLTDVPLILAPMEIEVLPMIIQSGIVPPGPAAPGAGQTKQEQDALRRLARLRCHILLSQDNGRNLIRELLIFVAAWDLREEELYFQLMTQIVESILANGLLPFTYHFLREAKDIISPAQAVIIKLLTHVMRRRQSAAGPSRNGAAPGLAIFPRSALNAAASTANPSSVPYPPRSDVQAISFILTQFRRHIIPQTCALIFLQGQIRTGHVDALEFPLNLWDMERMYEGVYQYLEFFAILTEGDCWKDMLGRWEISQELVTLIEELENGVPRGTARGRRGAGAEQSRGAGEQNWEPETGLTQTPDLRSQQHPAVPVSVERPYDPSASSVPEPPPLPVPTPAPLPLEDEPSEFEWRNLKKLAVLVLSSLVWKSKMVQDQLGVSSSDGLKGRGIRALLNCCKIDDYNPFIREHAIMALRFALEGHRGNQEVVRALERMESGNSSASSSSFHSAGGTATPVTGSGATQEGSSAPADLAGDMRASKGVDVKVPREVLDLQGYETFVNGRGQVMLKKKDPALAQEKTSAGADVKGKRPIQDSQAPLEHGEDDFMS